MVTTCLTSDLYRKMLLGGAMNLKSGRKTVNDLNVFPIPDGDTGDNMFMTISAGCEAASKCVPSDLGTCSAAVAKGMLMGARGNSGVILSRIFAGIAKGLDGLETATVKQYSDAMLKGVAEAYASVSNPVEGTILTVFRESSQFAASRLTPDSCFESFFEDVISELESSLERTPDLLDVLKEAGVVDSGGAGLDYITLGMYDAILGKGVDVGTEDSSDNPSVSVNTDLFTEDSILEFGYCTEFLLRLQTSKVGDTSSFCESEMKSYLESVGDSLVFFREGSLIRVHVHTKTPGSILDRCQCWGEFLTIKIENMTLQHHGSTVSNNFSVSLPIQLKSRKSNGFVAVASGAGLCDAFRKAGADEVIEGGQTMNPSTASFIEAFDRTMADNVFVFPNNSNVILTARQAAELYDKSKVFVIPTKDVGAGYVAMASLDTASLNPEEIQSAALAASESVMTVMVSAAIRDTEKDGIKVNAGDFIAFTKGGDIIASEKSRTDAVQAACSKSGAADHDAVLVFHGAGVPVGEAVQLKEKLERTYRRTDFILTDGGQPIFDYIIVLC